MKSFVLVVLGLTLSVSVANANSIGLSVGDCSSLQPAMAATVAPQSNSGIALTLVCTIFLDQPVPEFQCAQVQLDFISDSTTLPDWWRLDGSGCRSGSGLSHWTAAAGGTCHSLWDPWFAQSGSTPIFIEQWTCPADAPNRLHYKGAAAAGVHDDQPAYDAALGTNEWGLCSIDIGARHSVGNGACTGSSTGMTVVLREVDIQSTNPEDPTYTGFPNEYTLPGPGGNYVSINGGSAYGTVPARNRTWGALKSLYR